MRLLQRIIVGVFLLVLLAFVGSKIYISRTVDRVPPVITCDSDVIEVRVGASDHALLNGITATDNRDGDVTDQIMVKGVSQLIGANTAKVTYVAFDSSNNMSTFQRTVQYTNYERPRFSLNKPLTFPLGANIALLDMLTATDILDGDISDSICVTSQNVDTGTAGIYSVTVQATNSLGDVESLPLNVVIRNGASSYVPLALTDYIVYLDAGSSYRAANYITAPSAADGVEIDSSVDPQTPGIYNVAYTYQNFTVYQTVVVR